MACLLFEAGFVLGSCSLPRPAPVVVHEGAYDVIVLEPLSGEPPARHPAAVDQQVMETILRGIYVQKDERILQRLLSGRMPPLAVFADEQRALVSRFLVAALAQATSQQQVRFRLSDPRSPGEETTQGLLYCAEPFLYFTLQQFHRGQSHLPAEKPGRQLPDPTGLESWQLLFQLPEYVGNVLVNSSRTTLAINYVDIHRWLASREATTAGRVSPPPSPAALEPGRLEAPDQVPNERRAPSLHELIVRKDLEIESLKEEIRSLQHALAAQQGEVDRLKRMLENAQRR